MLDYYQLSQLAKDKEQEIRNISEQAHKFFNSLKNSIQEKLNIPRNPKNVHESKLQFYDSEHENQTPHAESALIYSPEQRGYYIKMIFDLEPNQNDEINIYPGPRIAMGFYLSYKSKKTGNVFSCKIEGAESGTETEYPSKGDWDFNRLIELISTHLKETLENYYEINRLSGEKRKIGF
ncbi:hypothetical protein WJR50_33090 [Catalinimonas sp. 4WD22]|uniref:hypothetical protein n=1 Tax=Catalinimonas locisalis TaxID=3133978 RepID=UPI003100F5C7